MSQKSIEQIADALSRIHAKALDPQAPAYMSVPADPERDADLILLSAIAELKQARDQQNTWFSRSDEIHRASVASQGKTPYDFSDIIYLTMGLAGEAGEVANEVKKAMRGDYDGARREEFLSKVREELVDTRVYLALLAHALDVWSNTSVNWPALILEKLERFAARKKEQT